MDATAMTRFAVKSLRAMRPAADGPEYLVEWEGYPEEEWTWEPRAHLDGCAQLLGAFEAACAAALPAKARPAKTKTLAAVVTTATKHRRKPSAPARGRP